MVRRIAVLAAVFVVIGGLFWAGWYNHHQRQLAMQRVQDRITTLTKNSPEEANSGAPDGMGDTLKGKVAPGFTLVDLNGKKVSLAQFKGHPVVVNFWATWCGPCKLEMPWFEEMNQKYKDKGLVILGLSQDTGTDVAEIAKSAKKIGVTYEILQPDDNIAKLYGGVDYLPETFYVDGKGMIAVTSAGAPTKDEIEANVKKIL
ncbi:TlpA family protein disulfide reductase [Granulicella paludicola]|uniref:TlpA family protein disulfide reductase n=1 Tax=Granulicella paludicola TaxID=474951 RepID=UPI0021E0C633|nr:TlpA disulfide reductase family protein [Granulicella paludicola]